MLPLHSSLFQSLFIPQLNPSVVKNRNSITQLQFQGTFGAELLNYGGDIQLPLLSK